MAINPKLIKKLREKLGVGTSRVYAMIQEKVQKNHLPLEAAAIALAAESGIGITRFATPEDLAVIRSVAAYAPPTPVAAPAPLKASAPKSSKKARPLTKKNISGPKARTVFVVHGRNTKIRDELFKLLREFDLIPLEWNEAIRRTGNAAPYVGEILGVAFKDAVAVIVLLTPDDLVKLKPKFQNAKDHAYEKTLFGQARPNVLFEAGMALGSKSKNTVLVQVGMVKPFSDIGGRHLVQLDSSAPSKKQLAIKLRNAGCAVKDDGTGWITVGNFDLE